MNIELVPVESLDEAKRLIGEVCRWRLVVGWCVVLVLPTGVLLRAATLLLIWTYAWKGGARGGGWYEEGVQPLLFAHPFTCAAHL